jgi:hypothetical protein
MQHLAAEISSFNAETIMFCFSGRGEQVLESRRLRVSPVRRRMRRVRRRQSVRVGAELGDAERRPWTLARSRALSAGRRVVHLQIRSRQGRKTL